MTDIVERLTKIAEDGFVEGSCVECAEAAAEITRLREALEKMVAWQTSDPGDLDEWNSAMIAARSALREDNK
jgi:hypothetical protein